MSRQLVSVKVVAQMLDLTPRRVQQLAAEGMITRASHGHYDLIVVYRDYIRLLRARSELPAPLLGEAMLRRARKRFLQVPKKVASQLAAPKSSIQITKLVATEINSAFADILASFSDPVGDGIVSVPLGEN